MLKPGQTAPTFDLPSADGDRVSLDALLADGPVVLYFYPADFTPGCTAQACMVRDLHSDLLAAGLRVVGISPQSPESHRRFAERYELPFRLLSDEDKSVIKAFGVNGPFGIAVRRATFLVDRNGTIADSVRADLNIRRHRAFIERAANAAPRGAVDVDDQRPG